MKKLLILSCITVGFMFLTLKTEAKVWRINNNSAVSADYDNFDDAQSAASDGDTIYVEGSSTSYGTATITKQLVLIGTGYFLSANDSTQTIADSSVFTRVYLNAGSEGSKLIGLSIIYTSSSYALYIAADSVNVTSCYIENSYSSSTGYCIYVSAAEHIELYQNFIYGSYASTNTVYGIYMTGGCSDIVIANNIIIRGTTASVSSSYSNYAILMTTSESSIVLANNTIFGNIIAYNTLFVNNIIGNANTTLTESSTYPNTYSNNICAGTIIDTTNNNLQSQAYSDVFTCSGNFYEDAYFELKTGSPAIGAGTNSWDCGAYGTSGDDRKYRKSGMYLVPSIYKATTPSTAKNSSTYNIQFESKTHN